MIVSVLRLRLTRLTEFLCFVYTRSCFFKLATNFFFLSALSAKYKKCDYYLFRTADRLSKKADKADSFLNLILILRVN